MQNNKLNTSIARKQLAMLGEHYCRTATILSEFVIQLISALSWPSKVLFTLCINLLRFRATSLYSTKPKCLLFSV